MTETTFPVISSELAEETEWETLVKLKLQSAQTLGTWLTVISTTGDLLAFLHQEDGIGSTVKPPFE
jgi:hypothetical protein